MFQGIPSLSSLISALQANSFELFESSPKRLRQNALRFIIVKLLLAIFGLVIYLPVLEPRGNAIFFLLVFSLIDLLFLIPVSLFAPRNLTTAIRWTQISVGITSATMTLGLYFAGGFNHPFVLTYFGLIPLALIVIPLPVMVWSSASMVTLAYLVLVVMQVTRLIPSPAGATPAFGLWLPIVGIVVLGFWIEAILLAIFTLNYETRRVDLGRRVYAESVWSTVGKTVISTQDLDQILTTVIQIINEKMHVETGSILLREPDTDTIKFAKIMRGDIEEFASVRLKLGQGIVGWVVATGQPALVPDVSRDPRWYNEIDKGTGFVTRSILCVPLIVGHEVIGAIELLNKRDGEFSQADVQLLESIAAPVAIAIQNAQLHQRVVTQLDDLTRMFHQVEHAKKEWETTVDAIDAGIVLTDEAGRVLRANNTLARWVKSTSREMVGQFCWRVVHNQPEPPDFCPHSRVIAGTKEPCESEIEDKYLGGVFRTTAFPLYDPAGKFVGAVSVLKDVSEEKRMQAQLIQSEKLAATGRLAASLAHEINNPLQGIQGCLELVEIAQSDAEQEQYLEMARKEVNRLGILVKSMLELARPSRGKPTRVNIFDLITEVLALSNPSIQKNSIRVSTQLDEAMPAIVGVADQLKQVFLNLVLNAIESMPNGGNLDIRAHSPKNGWLTVSIADSGNGIPADQLPHLFEPFYSTKTQGIGLGLSISHGILTTHGGRLTVESQIGKGSVFTVWLPVASAQAKPTATLEDEQVEEK
jgi:PAS domain S-box-containing protein